jgi:hypothetical protein
MTLAQSTTVPRMVERGVGVTALPLLGCLLPDHESLTVRLLTKPMIEREVGVLQSSTSAPQRRRS